MQLVPITAADPTLADLFGDNLDLPGDAAEAPAILRRLADPPQGWRCVGLAARDAAGDVVGAALVSTDDHRPDVGYLDLLVVRRADRRRGLGRELVSGVERALGTPTMRISGHIPCYAWPGIDVRYTPALCLAEAYGYTRTDIAWNMTAPLSGLPAPAELPGIDIRAATESDLATLLPWVASTWNEGWAWEVSQSVGHGYAACHVATRGDAYLGFAAFGALRPSLFGPMGTDPAARGLGIGGELLRRCLHDQRSLGLTSAQIGWVGPVAFYSTAAGGYVERVFFQYEKTR